MSYGMALNLSKFNLENIPLFTTMVIIGKRNTGKSVLVTDLLHRFKSMPAIVVMSGTEGGNKHFQNYVPDSFVYNSFSPTAIENIIARQQKLLQQGKSREDVAILVILDDCSYDKKGISADKGLRYMFMNGRHLGITTIITTQYAMDISPGLRYNVDFVFAFKDNTFTNKEKLYRNFFGVMNKAKDFYDVYDKVTVGYDCLVLDNMSRSNKVNEQIFWFRAVVREPGTFVFGPRSLWEQHAQMYRKRSKATGDTEHVKPSDGIVVNKREHIRETVF
jgi:Poxvirus A32 protein